jgi:hypothetical protein
VFKNFQERQQLRIDFPIEGLHGGALVAARGAEFVVFYDWGDGRLVRRIDVGGWRSCLAASVWPFCLGGAEFVVFYDWGDGRLVRRIGVGGWLMCFCMGEGGVGWPVSGPVGEGAWCGASASVGGGRFVVARLPAAWLGRLVRGLSGGRAAR